MASSVGIDMTDERSPLAQGLRIAAKDDSPERILINCEHLLVSLSATGPIARQIRRVCNLGTAGSKVVHCTLHRRRHCDSCPDRKPRPEGWEYEGKVRDEVEARHHDYVTSLAGTEYGLRFTNHD